LLIGPAEPIARGYGWQTRDVGLGGSFPDGAWTWALTLRLATNKDFPDEHGSAGPRDAIARPLLHVVAADGIARPCPLLEIDHVRGDAAGARWVLATTDAKLGAPAVRAIVQRALEGASELRGIPARASIDAGENAEIRVTAQRWREPMPSRVHLLVSDS